MPSGAGGMCVFGVDLEVFLGACPFPAAMTNHRRPSGLKQPSCIICRPDVTGSQGWILLGAQGRIPAFSSFQRRHVPWPVAPCHSDLSSAAASPSLSLALMPPSSSEMDPCVDRDPWTGRVISHHTCKVPFAT